VLTDIRFFAKTLSFSGTLSVVRDTDRHCIILTRSSTTADKLRDALQYVVLFYLTVKGLEQYLWSNTETVKYLMSHNCLHRYHGYMQWVLK